MSAASLMLIGNSSIALCQPVGSEDSGGAMVTVSGRVVDKNYKQGHKMLYWFKEGHPSLGGAPVTLNKSGPFSIKIPKDAGNIYVVINYYDPAIDINHIGPETSTIAFASYGPIKIGSDNVELGDLRLEKPGKSLFEGYRGPTVKITGKVIVNNYDGGLIRIVVKNKKSFKGKTVSDVASKNLAAPGDYTLKVPQGAGDVYIYALSISTDDPEVLKTEDMHGARIGYYAGNPLKIKSSDLDNMDIVIK